MTTPHRIEIHTPDHMLNDPAVRAGLYGVIRSAMLIQRAATGAQRQLTQHAYPGQPSQRAEHTTADKVINYAEAAGITLLPWQQRALRDIYAECQACAAADVGVITHLPHTHPTAPTPPCLCWYWTEGGPTALRITTTGYREHSHCEPGGAYASGFNINPHCPHHG